MSKHTPIAAYVSPSKTQSIYRFDNDYGASVVCSPYSYGGPEGFFEIAVLDKKDHLCYSTPITDDVIGWLTIRKVQNLLTKIANLPKEL